VNAFILLNGEARDECLGEGIAALRQGASAMDAAEIVARAVEADANEHSVGFSGLPNILGEVELDAAIMDGRTLASGAVAALKDYLHPISVARQVMERLPHVLLAGEGAGRFAAEIGAERGELLTPEARDIWRKRIVDCGLTIDDLEKGRRTTDDGRQGLIALTKRVLAHREGGDTMNVMVRDAAGHIVVAVTTSGIAWKYPGRVGDSPVLGAGLYADDRYGAAACMGLGEITIRQGSSLRAVLGMRMGMNMAEAGRAAVRDMLPLCYEAAESIGNSFNSPAWVRLLMMDAQGNVGGYCTHEGFSFKAQSVDEERPKLVACEWVREE
jgi:L-asparaginase / beta-aspartyl-peptidase